MQNNHFFLRALCDELQGKIIGFTVVSCFSQNKDELIFEFNDGQQSFLIRADLSPASCCLSFPGDFKRANKNSVDLFTEVILKKIIGLRAFRNERSFEIQLEDSISILLKMHGKFSNILLCKSEKVKSLFRNSLQGDFDIEVTKLDRSVDWSQENFITNIDHLKESYPALGHEPWIYLKANGFEKLDVSGKWNLWSKMLSFLDQPKFYIVAHQGKLQFTLLPFGQIVEEFTDPISAVTEFYHQSISTNSFQTRKASVLASIQKKIKSTESFLQKNKIKLQEIGSDRHYQTWGDLIMAHLHEIKTGTSKIILADFYTGQPVEIKLKPELNAQKNAEIFYRKSKNHQIEIDKLSESISQKEKELWSFKELSEKIAVSTELKAMLSISTAIEKKDQAKEKVKRLPYHEFEFKNYKIWVGKNAEANDELTLKFSYKEDLWLHAKDVAGSHVLIKHQAGKNFPKDVIEYAASLAAHYSKRKNESLCPVAITPKKFVRKRKGDPAGLVVVEKEEVILVAPKSFD